MQKILVIGCCGTGKSTLSRRLSQQLDLPLYHLDQIWWQPGWQHIEREDFDRQLQDILIRERWIIDGNYLRTLPERLCYADTVIFLDYSRPRALWQAFKRFILRRRPDKLDGCREHLDTEFIRFIWKFHQTIRPEIQTLLADFSGKTYIFSSPDELKSALEKNFLQ